MPTLVRVCPECGRLNPGSSEICRACGASTAEAPRVDAASLPRELRDAGVAAGDPLGRADGVIWLVGMALVKSLGWAIAVGVVGLFCGLLIGRWEHQREPYVALVLAVAGALAGGVASLHWTVAAAIDRRRESRGPTTDQRGADSQE